MNSQDQTIKKVLVEQNYVSREEMEQAEAAAQNGNITLVDHLIKNNLITRTILGQAMSEQYHIGFLDIQPEEIPEEYTSFIPEPLAKKHRILVIDQEEERLTVATDDPEHIDSMQLQNIFRNNPYTLVYVLPGIIEKTLAHDHTEIGKRFLHIVNQGQEIAPSIIEELLEDAIASNASDVHFEPKEEEACIRFRIDGLLQEIACVEKEHYERVARVIKLRADLDTEVHKEPQDGTIRLVRDGSNVDLRVSIVPVLDGEKIVIRILSEYISSLSFQNLGLSKKDEQIIRKITRNPFGMILAVGPTGSGKTTTLYSILRLRNNTDTNIMTIEDPVEYKIKGVNHMQVNPKRDVTFARGLRSIVRQDPDVVLVGEIRDEETAEIAANAALTGHLVLSSFHANDAATAFPRLVDMGIEPFLLSSTLEMVVGQRLVRRICTSCRFSQEIPRKQLVNDIPDVKRYFEKQTVTLYEGKGCTECNDTGYKGRIGIFELIYSTPEIQDLVLQNPTSREVWELARGQGAHTLFEDGIEKVKAGVTTLEEVKRVAMPPEYRSIYG